MSQEIVHCAFGHAIDLYVPEQHIDFNKLEVQRPDLIGKACDCGKFTYSEGECGCGGQKSWKVIWKEKI